MSDRIVVMNRGRQSSRSAPAHALRRRLLGATNFLDATLIEVGPTQSHAPTAGALVATPPVADASRAPADLAIRPSYPACVARPADAPSWPGPRGRVLVLWRQSALQVRSTAARCSRWCGPTPVRRAAGRGSCGHRVVRSRRCLGASRLTGIHRQATRNPTRSDDATAEPDVEMGQPGGGLRARVGLIASARLPRSARKKVGVSPAGAAHPGW